jgi:hypothetical protein
VLPIIIIITSVLDKLPKREREREKERERKKEKRKKRT